MAARKWTPEQRQRQREAIQRWKPWQQATGPKSAAGKAASAGNAYKGGHTVKLRRLIVELKVCEALIQAHSRQVLNYLRASGLPVGLLFNFAGPSLTVKRVLAH